MTSFKTLEVAGWKAAIHGMRHPLKSHAKSDSYFDPDLDDFIVGENDLDLMRRLCQAAEKENNPAHNKFLRMIQVWVDIQAPRYWWHEMATYQIGTTTNSESTMHRLMKDGISRDDLDYEWGFDKWMDDEMIGVINTINTIIDIYHNENLIQKEKEKYFIAAKAFLPECYMQKRTVNLNYQVLRNIYNQRMNHRLPQWSQDFVQWVSSLPLGKELIMNQWD